MDACTTRLELSIDVGSDPIQGSVVVGEGAPQQFCGWMELAAAIESARGRHSADPVPGGEVPKSLGWAPGAKGS
jgi:hypothetical protein